MPHHKPECMHKVWFTIFKVKVIARAHMIKMWCCLLYLQNRWSFCYQTWFWWYIIIRKNVLWRNGIVVFKVKVTANFKMLMNVCPDDILWIAEPFTTKLGSMINHNEPNCFKIIGLLLSGQGHSEGVYNQNMTISFVSSKLLVGLLSNFVW